MFGTAAAVAFAFTAALTKMVTDFVASDWVSVFRHWQTYGLAVFGLLAVFLTQNAYHAGPIAASQSTLVLVDPLASILIGVGLFGDNLRTAGAWGPLEALSLLVLFAGAITLCHSPLVSGVKGEDPASAELLSSAYRVDRGPTPDGPDPAAPTSDSPTRWEPERADPHTAGVAIRRQRQRDQERQRAQRGGHRHRHDHQAQPGVAGGDGRQPSGRDTWSQSTAERAPVTARLGPRLRPTSRACGSAGGRAASSEAAGRLLHRTLVTAPMAAVLPRAMRGPAAIAAPTTPGPACRDRRPGRTARPARARRPSDGARPRSSAALGQSPAGDRGRAGAEHDHRHRAAARASMRDDGGRRHRARPTPSCGRARQESGRGAARRQVATEGDGQDHRDGDRRRRPRPAAWRPAKAPARQVRAAEDDQVGQVGAGEEQGRAVGQEDGEVEEGALVGRRGAGRPRPATGVRKTTAVSRFRRP